ncbi:MAG: hypothetical protein KF873_08520 [Gemmataceae bacterium]|nr:hypothetical protein [Gemmataceae bacterium]
MRAFILIGLALAIASCKKKEKPAEVAKLEPGPGKVMLTPSDPALPVLEPPPIDPPMPAVVPGPGGGVVANPGPLAGGGGAGAVQAVRGAAKKTVDANDLKMIHTFIEYASGASGRMPSAETTRAALKQEAPEIERKIYEGLIVLNPAKNREEIWAYEAKALESSGWVATNNGVETMDAATLKRRLGK